MSVVPDAATSRFVPFSSHVAPDVIKTTGGDYLVAWRLGGLPFVGREDQDLEHRHATFNRLLQSLRAPDVCNVAFWTHDIRRRRRIQDEGGAATCAFSQTLSDAYFASLARKQCLRNELHLTMLHRPPQVVGGMRRRVAELSGLAVAEREAVARIHELAANVEAVLRDYAPRRLRVYERSNGVVFSELLEFYGYLLNRIDEPVPVLDATAAAYLPVSRHTFSVRTGHFVVEPPSGPPDYGAILSVKEYADATWPGILNGLKYLGFEYVLTQSFSPMARLDALRALERTKGMMLSSGDRAVSQIAGLDQAMDQLASGHFVLGEYHFSLAIHAEDQAILDRYVAEARAELSNAGFVSAREDLAVASAYFAQLPANWRHRTRLANVSSLNFLGLSPLHNFAGGKRDRNPRGPCVTTLQATNGQPYHFNFHATHPAEDSFGEKALGNTLVIGKSGTGKTALVNFLLSQALRLDPAPTIFFFDKDRGAEIFVRACGGSYLALEDGRPTGFNPLQCEATEANVRFLVELVKLLAGREDCTAREDEDVHRAVHAILDTPMPLRTMANLRKGLPNVGDDGLYARLRRWTAGHGLGWVFDNPVDTVDLARAGIIGFDYTDLLENAEVRVPVMRYLLHRLEGLIDGRRLVYVMDEFWKVLEGGGALREFARNKQKTIRKQNGLGIFATQSPEDALASGIAATLVEQTATLVLLPNPNASRSDYVDGLKLTDAEYRVVASLDERSRCFLVKQGHASAVCRLDLSGLDDMLAVISASTDNIAVMHAVMAERAAVLGVSRDDLQPGQWLPGFQARRKGRQAAAARSDDARGLRPMP